MPLTHLRVYLILINLMVFLSALASVSAGRDATIIKNDLFEERVATKEPFNDEVISTVNMYIENILYFTSFSLALHWVIFGVFVSSRFDGTYEKPALGIWIVHNLAMVVWEVGLAILLERMVSVIPSHHVMSGFYSKWTSTLATLFIAVVPAQLITVFLPLFSDLTREEKVLSMDEAFQKKIWHTEMPQMTHNFPVASLYHTEMPDQILKKSKPVHIPRAGQALSAEEFTPRKGRVEESPPRYGPPYVQNDYVDMLGTTPPPSYHSLVGLGKFII